MSCLDFSLFETMLIVEDSIFLFRPHLMRLYESAKKLGFLCSHIESLLQNLPTSSHIPQSPLYKAFCEAKSQDYDIKQHHTIALALCFLESLHSSRAQSHILGLHPTTQYTHEYPHVWDSTALLYALLYEAKSQPYTPLSQGTFLCRLVLERNGKLSFTFQPLQKITNHTIFLATQNNMHCQHKTTRREHFALATHCIARNECFDYIYMDNNGMLLEGSRSNIILAMQGIYYTPKANNILEGTLRNILVKYGICKEKILYKEDLYKADAIYCINSVRGIVLVMLENNN